MSFVLGVAESVDEPEPGGTHRDLRGCTLEPAVGFEPTTYGLQNRCTTAVLCWRQRQGGGNEASVRTRKRHRGDTRGVCLVEHPRHQAGSARLGPLRPDSQTTLPSNGSPLPAEPRCTRQSFGAPAPRHERNDSVRMGARPRRSRAPDAPMRGFARSLVDRGRVVAGYRYGSGLRREVGHAVASGAPVRSGDSDRGPRHGRSGCPGRFARRTRPVCPLPPWHFSCSRTGG